MSPHPDSEAALVVVGGGFAGLFTALQAARQDAGSRVVLVEPNPSFVFLPLLYELLSGELGAWQVAPGIASLLAGSGVVHLRERVTTIDHRRRRVSLSGGGSLGFGTCVIATGSVPHHYGIPGLPQHGLGFHTLSDVAVLQQKLHELRAERPIHPRLVVVGGGPTGVELSCKLADLLDGAAELELIEMGDDILPRGKAFNREQARSALQRRDVRVRLQTRVLEALPGAVRVSSRVDDSHRREETLPHHGLIWVAGVRPRPPVLQPPLPLDGQGRLCCGADLAVQGTDDLFALGDVATISSDDEPPPPATAQVAFQQAALMARNLQHRAAGEPTRAFRWNDLGEMISLGIGDAAITGLGLTLAGPRAFQLRRLAYLTRLPGLPLQLRAAAGWLSSAVASR
ncbi:NAD(P)/FAD-dependent oxidoreductase [Synechococcus sp. RSCCF101]|uniref:NAD(P)/FAD-dependent oxidoreductase n=1 Tax=Synechococcus sp. RSCCF101 TaxID=2511069 RepID=UPI001249344A|nr:FAD-dependent oxidoreductase [Synechococcus sp. RSCCF101]QEY32958.1 NAD(P)/FAD-dependent oxidoreductase [Synechococcus sp. RSCCF101]